MFLRVTPNPMRYPCGADNPAIKGLVSPSFRVHVHQWAQRDLSSLSEAIELKGLSKGAPYFDLDTDSVDVFMSEMPEWAALLESAVRSQYGSPKPYPCMGTVEARPSVMGILNITPDSFSDGGQHLNLGDALDHATRMEEDGADVIDIGGESTRPFSSPVSAKEEMERIIPVIEQAYSILKVPMSVDTMKAEVAEKAIAAGARMVNDINGLRDDSMLSFVASADVPVVIMHMRGNPQNMQARVGYDDVIREIVDELHACTVRALDAGVKAENIMIDPGIGFGKSVRDNLEIVKRLREFRCLGFPVLLGASRKSFIGKTLSVDEGDRLEGSLAVSALAMQNGADMVRVHDVRETVRTLRMVKAVESLTI